MNEKSEFRSLIEGMAGDMVDGVHTSAIARIEAYDPVLMKADLTILQTGDEIFDVPVGHLNVGEFIIRPPYKVGDKVIVVFSENPIDEVISTGEEKKSQLKEKHDISDAMVVCGLHTWETTLPSEHGNDLVIAKKDFSAKVVINEDGQVLIDANEIRLGENATEGLTGGMTLKQYLDQHEHDLTEIKSWMEQHTHNYDWTSTGGSGTTDPPSGSAPDSTGAPTKASPSPSEKVKVE